MAENKKYVLWFEEIGIEDVALCGRKEAMAGLDKSDVQELAKRGKRARELMLEAKNPQDLWTNIKAAYDRLAKQYGPDPDVAVRSSATAEDLPTASFAGQQETFLNVRGYDELREACIKCYASLFTDRAISQGGTLHWHHEVKMQKNLNFRG